MRRNLLADMLLLVFFCLFLFTGCNATAPAEAPVNTPAPASEEVPTVMASEPTALPPQPTATTEPIPCTIVFESDRDGNFEIYRMDADGSNVQNLSNNSGDDFRPAWSPDGSQIAFVSSRATDQEGGEFIYIMNADGSDVRQLTFDPWSDWPDWSHDGSMITYTYNDDIYVIKADGSGESINLTNSPEKDEGSSWSPDGSKIAWRSGDGQHTNVFVMDADGSNILQISDNGQNFGVQWTVDGRLLMGWGWENKEQICQNCIVNADGTNIEDAGGKGELQRYLPFWTSDGQRVELVASDHLTGDYEIYLVSDIYPDMFLNLTNNPANDANVDWPASCGPVSTAEVAEESTQAQNSENTLVIGYEDSENNMSAQNEEDLLKACNELHIQCIKSNDMSELTEQNVDAIISFSNIWHAAGAYPKIHEAVSKGILLILLNGETGEPGAYNLSVESDAVQKSLAWMFSEMDGKGKFVYYNFGDSEFHQSIIEKALQENPGIEAVKQPASFDSEAFTEESISDMILSDPEIGAIWASNNLNAIFWGVHNSNREELPLMLCNPRMDILEPWKESLSVLPTFKCFTTIHPGGVGYEGIYVAYYMLSGEQVDPAALGGEAGNTFIYDYPIITNDNLEEWLEKSESFTEGDWSTLQLQPMTPEEIKEKWFLE